MPSRQKKLAGGSCFRSTLSGHTFLRQFGAQRLPMVTILVPAQLAWCLQTGDTHVFAMFKDHLFRTCQDLAIDRGGGSLTVFLLLQALSNTALNVLSHKAGQKAFDDLRYRGIQRWIAKRTMENYRSHGTDN